MNELALQFTPESVERLIARFPEALEPTYDPQEIAARKVTRPGQQRKHVFDFEDGVRCIASHEMHNGRKVLHMSFSLSANSYVRVDNFMRVALAKAGMLQRKAVAPIYRELSEVAIHFVFAEYTGPDEGAATSTTSTGH